MSIAHQSADGAASLLSGPSPRLIFKHSPTCGISRAASIGVSMFAEARPDVRVVLVDVLSERALSRRIAADLGVAHQSPQALLVADGKALWHASHGSITLQRIEAAFGAMSARPASR